MVGFWYLPIEGLHLIIDDVVVEDERGVGLDVHLEVEGIACDGLGVVLHHLADVVVLLFVLLHVGERLLDVLLVDVREAELHLVRQVLGRLDVDQ